jgi:hypothetical protein
MWFDCAGGEYLSVIRAGVGYVRTRVVVPVSNLWDYPTQRRNIRRQLLRDAMAMHQPARSTLQAARP